MANRILAGNRSTGGHGLYVSRTGEDVTSTTNPLAFDSRAASSPVIHSAGQGILASNSNAPATISHNLGYTPLFAVRWCTQDELDGNNKATKVFDPRYSHMISITEPEGIEEIELVPFGVLVTMDSSDLEIQKFMKLNTDSVYYSYIIFNEPDYTGGLGL